MLKKQNDKDGFLTGVDMDVKGAIPVSGYEYVVIMEVKLEENFDITGQLINKIAFNTERKRIIFPGYKLHHDNHILKLYFYTDNVEKCLYQPGSIFKRRIGLLVY